MRAFADVRVGQVGSNDCVVSDRVDGRVEIPAEIDSDRPDWRVVTRAESESMGEVIEAARPLGAGRGDRPCRRTEGQIAATRAILLAESQKTGPDIA